MPSTTSSRDRLRNNDPPSSLSRAGGNTKHAAVSVSSVLSAHAGNPAQALEHLVLDRNTLSSQNAQLWKLIEKQRSGYNQVLKELERVRNERDLYKARLHALGESPEGLVKKEKDKVRPLRSATSHLALDATEKSKSRQQNDAYPSIRVEMQRRGSEGILTPRTLEFQRQELGSSSSRVDEPPQRIRRQRSLSERGTRAEHTRDPAQTSDPPPIVIPPSGAQSFPSASSTSTSETSHNYTPYDEVASSPPPLDPSATLPLQPRKPLISATQTAPAVMTTAPSDSSTYPSNVISAFATTTPSQTYSSPALSGPPPGSPTALNPPRLHPHAMLRDSSMSAISVPDEVRRYIAGESPAASPNLNGGFRAESPAQMYALEVARANGLRDRDKDGDGDGESMDLSGEGGEFLDLAEDSTGEGTEEGLGLGRGEKEEWDETKTPVATREATFDVSTARRKSSSASTSRKASSKLTVEEFPLPPSTSLNGDARSGSQQNNSDAQSNVSEGSGDQILVTHIPSSSALTPSGAAFRALPLLPTDIPYTRVSVAGSSIKANDRGKEVLSFIVNVDPGKGRGKEGWKVEKLFSDVLALDQRVRVAVGKGVARRIASLPDGKLWRDRAPAKADQRKAALENYLQSLINLPVKDKTEIIAFFTSDIVREARKPVHQAGYKEGYLTKRGKNFGGWKLRYFVLQGPVLEYYENRGGAHLGSITITGAQIGRQQQKTTSGADDSDSEYRHAFLIIEAKRGATGSSPRHVLCAESDAERDSWVEVLVRYVMGSYNEEPGAAVSTGLPNGDQASENSIDGRPSTSSVTTYDSAASSSPGKRPRGASKEDVGAPEATNTNTKPFPTTTPEDIPGVPRMSTDASSSADAPLSSSVPTASAGGLGAVDEGLAAYGGVRANSEMGHYNDVQSLHSQQRGVLKKSGESRRSNDHHSRQPPPQPQPPPPPPAVAAAPVKQVQAQVAAAASSGSADRPITPDDAASGKMKISGPLNGAPIPAGFKFGAKDPTPEPAATTDRREKAKSRMFWGFGRQAEKPPAIAHVPRNVFGVTLEEALDVVEIANLPAIVFRCIQYLEAKQAELEEGIYRLSGSSAVIKALKDRFNLEGDVDLLASDEYWDPHAIAGLLKTFLRELPTSILTRDLHLKFLAVMDFVDPQERIRELSHLIATLPLANYSLLRALTAHLILIVQNANVNKMTMRNVGIVFSPTLGIPAGVFSLMLGEFNRVFNVNPDPADSEPAQTQPSAEAGQAPVERSASSASRRNSRRYADGAADQLLGHSGRSLNPIDDGDEDGDEISVQSESGAETTENEPTVESSSSLPHYDQETARAKGSSRASHVAADRGLHLNTAEKNRRNSRGMVGLPRSPRPSPGQNNTSPANQFLTSPPHTPR